MINNLLIAHKGMFNNIDIPENSIKAFKLAIKNKLPIELDIQLTKDNKLIVFHDNNLKRLTGLNKSIEDADYKTIKKLRLINTNEKIPTLEEVLKLINGQVLLDIEIKPTKKTNKICSEITKLLDNYKHPFIIKSFDIKIILWLKKNRPNYIRGILINKNIYTTLIGKFIINYCNPNFLAISKKLIDKKGIKNHFKKYNILIWTLTKKHEMNKYQKITNNYICNNLPYK